MAASPEWTTRLKAAARFAGSARMVTRPLVTGAIAFGAALLVSQLFGSDRDDDNDEGWDDYWHRRQFDWHDRHFYPRPRWQWSDDRPDHSWGWERQNRPGYPGL